MNFPCDCGTRLGSRLSPAAIQAVNAAGKYEGAGAQGLRLRGLVCAIDVYFVG